MFTGYACFEMSKPCVLLVIFLSLIQNRFSRYIIESYEHVYVLISVPVVVTENQAPRNQKFSNGTNAQVKCAPQGDVQVSWLDKDGQPIFSTRKNTYYYISIFLFLGFKFAFLITILQSCR